MATPTVNVAQQGQLGVPATQGNVYPDAATLQYLASIYGYDVTAGLGMLSNEEAAREFDLTLKRLQDEAQKSYDQAIKVAQIYAGSYTAEAQATVQAAQITAQKAIEVAQIAAEASKYDSQIRLQIAKMADQLGREQYMATELSKPGDWLTRVGFFRGQTPEQQQALAAYGGGTVYGGQIGTPTTTTPTATTLPRPTYGGGTYPQGIAGEAGRPELVTARPEGVSIEPLGRYGPPTRKSLAALPKYQQGGWMPWGRTGRGSTFDWQPATAPETAQPAQPAESPVNQLPFLQYARAGGQKQVPAFQEWTGPTTIPAAGITTRVPPPWNYNLMQFQNMSRVEQTMLAATWRGLGMIAGDTEDEMLANAYEAMRRSAWTGAAIPAVTQYGSW
jgi:hypothetical protein